MSEFTYPPQSADPYQKLLEDSLRAHRVSGRNNYLLIKKHMELASQAYATHLKGSKIRIVRPNHLSNEAILTIFRYGSIPQASEDPSAETTWRIGNITCHQKGQPYPYRAGEAYVDFAAREIGGGVFGSGFVQEEIAMLEGSFLPWVAAVRGTPHPRASFFAGISMKNLEVRPVVFQFRRFLEVIHQDEIYGGSRLNKINGFDAGRYLRPLVDPVDITMIAVAAKSYQSARPGTSYRKEEIGAMAVAATRGFYDALVFQHQDGKPLVLHTGNWGTGAFRNSRRMMWAIQVGALQTAYALFCQTVQEAPPVTFHYDAFDEAGLREANLAHKDVAALHPANLSLEEFCKALHTQAQGGDTAWQVRAGKERRRRAH